MSDFYMISLKIPHILLPSYLAPNPIPSHSSHPAKRSASFRPESARHQSSILCPQSPPFHRPSSLFLIPRTAQRTNELRQAPGSPSCLPSSPLPPHTLPGRCASPSSQIWPKTDHFAYRIERLYTIQGVSGQESDSSAEFISRVNWLLS